MRMVDGSSARAPQHVVVPLCRYVCELRDARAGKVEGENLMIVRAALSLHVRAHLTKTETMTEAAAAKDEVCARALDREARTFKHVPAERAPDDGFEIPTAQDTLPLAAHRDNFGAPARVAFDDANLIEARAHIAALVLVQRARKLRGGQHVRPT